jgi:presqualene diphosphate synthase
MTGQPDPARGIPHNKMRANLLIASLFGLTLLTPTVFAAPRFEVPEYLLQLPRQSYQLIQQSFRSLYQQTNFTPSITNSYFNYSDLYKFVGVPLAITPQAGFQLEVFGQLYNLASQSYVHMSQDMSLYRMLRADMIGNPNDQMAVGMGLGVPLSPMLTVKALASTNQIPGYGQANYALGIEWRY